MKKVSLARRWVLSTILTVSFTLFIVLGSSTLILETQVNSLTELTFDEYLQTKIESMELASYQFATSIDSLFEGYISSLNKTVQYLSYQLFNNSNNTFVVNSSTYSQSDELLFLKGTINATVKKESNAGYLDFFGDGVNILDTPGTVFYGDILNSLAIQGKITAELNASLSGSLGANSSLFLYYENNNSDVFSIDITDLYDSYFSNSFNVTSIIQWNEENSLIPQPILDLLNLSEFSHFKTFYVLNTYSSSNVTLHKEQAFISKIEGCIDGYVFGGFKGLIRGNIEGKLTGEIDLKPKYIYQHFPSLRQSFLQWIYFATPDYFIFYPHYPNYYDQEHLVALSIDFNWLKRPWYNEILSQELNETVKGLKSHFSSLGVDYVFKNLFISLGQAIYNSTSYQGLLVLDFNLDFLKNVLELALTVEDFNWLVDENGNILYSPEYFEKPASVFQPYPIENILKLNNSALSQSFKEAKQGSLTYIELDFNSTEYLVFYRKLYSPNWWMIHFSPLDIIFSEIQPLVDKIESNFTNIEVILLITSFLILSTVGVIEVFLTRNYTQNLTKLRRAISKVSEGDFSVSFDFNRERLNEVTEVFFHFEEMALKLNEALENERQSTVLANLSLDLFIHDIGNYLHALNGYLSLISEISNSESKNFIEKMDSVLEKIERLRDRIIVLRSLGTSKITFTRVNLNNRIEQALHFIQKHYAQYEIKCEKQFQKNFTLEVCNFFNELIENIFEFFIKQSLSKTVEFTISVLQDKDIINLIIEGKGKGFSESRRIQIQEELSTGKRLSDFNLITAYMIVKRSGGKIIIENRQEEKPEEGSRVILKIPQKNPKL